MIEIAKFYFSIIAKIINNVWSHLEISPGVNYGYFVIGTFLFVAFVKILRFEFNTSSSIFGDSTRNESKIANKRK